MRILTKKTQEGWKIRFGFGNPWNMPSGEWVPVIDATLTTPAHYLTTALIAQFPGADVFTICALGEDLEQVQ